MSTRDDTVQHVEVPPTATRGADIESYIEEPNVSEHVTTKRHVRAYAKHMRPEQFTVG
jgi:hypothetical protein